MNQEDKKDSKKRKQDHANPVPQGNRQGSPVVNLDDWIEIGKIVAPQGLDGEVRVYPDTDFPERFE